MACPTGLRKFDDSPGLVGVETLECSLTVNEYFVEWSRRGQSWTLRYGAASNPGG